MTGEDGLYVRCQARVGALRIDVELATASGATVVVGPNGAGKSSLLDLVLGVRAIEQGRVVVGGRVLVDTATGVDVPLEQRGLGYVPQDLGLFPHMTVRQNVAFAVDSARGRLDRDARRRLVETSLRDLDVEALGDRPVGVLSGGERQRVALARALSVGPRALLLDEPLAALDAHARGEVRAFLASHLASLRLPTLIVTHDPDDARRLGQRVVVLEQGTITQTGTWGQLVAHPATRFVEQLVSTR